MEGMEKGAGENGSWVEGRKIVKRRDGGREGLGEWKEGGKGWREEEEREATYNTRKIGNKWT